MKKVFLGTCAIIIIIATISIISILFDEKTSINNEDVSIGLQEEITDEQKFKALFSEDIFHTLESYEIQGNDNSKTNYKFEEQSTIVINPLFTQTAYSSNGFYDFYTGRCDESCLTVEIQENFDRQYISSGAAAIVLSILGYPYITDIDVDKEPSILDKYDKVILLHSEYVTQRMFDAITNHPKVIYLYPNALYAEIETDYEKNQITLIRGHGYPEKIIDNGFDWEFDNTRPDEFDSDCLNLEFREIDNGIQLNCYPEKIIMKNLELLKRIKQY